jgi:riboflavin kinase/FMN adenylyltransferase
MPAARVYSAGEWVARFGEQRKRTVVTIGNFDGMHRGHREILRRVIRDARLSDCMATVLTLFPHPVQVLRPGMAPALLMTLEQRLASFDEAGIDAVLVLEFNSALSKLQPADFCQEYLVDCLRARKVLVGEKFRFGYRQEGDVSTLTEMGQFGGFEVETVEPVIWDGKIASSTAVREAVREGHMEEAAAILGYPFALKGEIKTGTGQGRKLIVPTLNLKTDQELLPKKGVYVTETMVGGKTYRSVTNVGVRPTFNGAGTTIESHLFDFNESLTSGRMEVRFLKRLREERKFEGPEALRAQVLQDIEEARQFHARQQS